MTNISEITGIEDDAITMQSIFEFHQTGFDDEGKVLGDLVATGVVPKFISELQDRKIPVNMDLFKTPEDK